MHKGLLDELSCTWTGLIRFIVIYSYKTCGSVLELSELGGFSTPDKKR